MFTFFHYANFPFGGNEDLWRIKKERKKEKKAE